MHAVGKTPHPRRDGRGGGGRGGERPHAAWGGVMNLHIRRPQQHLSGLRDENTTSKKMRTM